MILKEALDRTTVFLKTKQMESPRLEAELLVSHALSMGRVDLYLKFDMRLSEEELEKCRELLKRRVNGESLAYIVGYKNFYKHKFKVGPGVLVPRPESEWIVERVLQWAKRQEEYHILDLGTGTGCLGLSLVRELPNSSVTLVDQSSTALRYAEHNAQELKLMDRVRFIHSTVEKLNLEMNSYDIVIANPPYIDPDDEDIDPSVKKFEPHEALFASEKGLAAFKSWIPLAAKVTRRPGICIFEIGATQSAVTRELFVLTKSFDQIIQSKDLAGLDRNITAIKEEQNG